MLTQGLFLVYVTWAQDHGREAQDFVPVTMLITAAVFAAASLPTFLVLKERARPVPVTGGESVVRAAFARLAQTVRDAARYQDLARFLVCIVFYQAGIQTVVALQHLRRAGARLFHTGHDHPHSGGQCDAPPRARFRPYPGPAGAYPHDRPHPCSLIATTLIAWAATGPGLFWVAANLAGLCLGSSQSAGRALVAYLSPADRHAEFFGLWGLSVKLSSILGPLTYGVVTWITDGDHRLAMLVTGAFFVVGLLLLMGIDVPRGRRAAGEP
jgi:UMF1 family MFS transporter